MIFLSGCSKNENQKNNQEQEDLIENIDNVQEENPLSEELSDSNKDKEVITTNQESPVKNTASVDSKKARKVKRVKIKRKKVMMTKSKSQNHVSV